MYQGRSRTKQRSAAEDRSCAQDPGVDGRAKTAGNAHYKGPKIDIFTKVPKGVENRT